MAQRNTIMRSYASASSMSYKQATVGVLLLFLSLVSAQNSATPAKAAKAAPTKHLHRADDLPAVPDASNHLFKDNIGNNKANVGMVNGVVNVSSAVSGSKHRDSKKPAYTNSSNFLVTKVSQLMTSMFGNITRHSPAKAVAIPVKITGDNATSDVPLIGGLKRPSKTGNSAGMSGKSAGTFGDPKHMRRKLHPKSGVESTDLGKVPVPRGRVRTTSTKLHVLPHTRRAKSAPEEA